MPNPTWMPLPPSFQLQAASVDSPWLTMPFEFSAIATYLKLVASGTWSPFAGLKDCGPDGLVGQTFPDEQLLVTDCAVGTLVGRFGGSSASLKTQTPDTSAGESKPFAVGRVAIVKLPDKFVGPLFLGFNVLRHPVKVQSLQVDVFVAS